MAITQIRGAQVLDASIDENDLNASVAGDGLSGGAGTALAVDLNELTAAAVDAANDSIALIDATDSGSKKESIADLMTAVAGVGLVASSGVLAFDLNELSAVAVDVSADLVAIEDATDNSSKKESIADIMTAVAGNGLGASAGVLAVNVDASTITISGDTLGVPTDGITATELAANSVDSSELISGAVDVDHLSDLRVTEGTALVADFAAGTLSTDNGTTVTVVSVSAGTIAVADADVSFVEVDTAGTVTSNIVGFTQGRLPLAEVTAAAGDITVVTDKRAWLDIDLGSDTGLASSNFVDNEVPTGDLNGADVTYTLANSPSPVGSLKVYLNGIRQDEGGSDDYTLSGSTITFAAAPISTDKILTDYRKA